MTIASAGYRGTDFKGVTLAASGPIVAAVPGKRIRVFAYIVSSLLATQIKFQSNATDISLTMSLADKGGMVVPNAELAWFLTNPGEPLNLNMSVATTVGIQVIYDIVE